MFTVFLLVILSFFNTAQAERKTREPFQHSTLGEVTLVKVYKKNTDAVDYKYFENTVTVSDPTFGEMEVVNEYDEDGELSWQTRYKENYNDPQLGIVDIEQEFEEGEIYSDYRIRNNYKDPELGTVDVIISFYNGELDTTYKVKELKKEDPSLGIVNTTIVYEDDVKDTETITYGTTTIKKSFHAGELFTETKDYVDEQSIHRTEELKYHSNDFPREILSYRNGKQDGVQKYYSYDGTLQREANYQNGVKFGVQNTYHNNGKLEDSGTINDNGKLNGDFRKYRSDGDLETKGSYADGNKVGTWEHYGKNHNPSLVKKCVYEEDVTVCENVDYYDYGSHFTAKSFTNYVKKKGDRFRYREGAFTSYHNYEKKLIKDKGEYKNGEKFGPWVSKDLNGNTICNVTYLDNNQIKGQIFAHYSEKGIKTSDGSNIPNYSCGGKTVHKGQGYKNRFDEGKPSSEEIYFDGELIADKLYKHGVLTFERTFKNDERVAVTGYDKQGRISYKWKIVGDSIFNEQFNYEAHTYDSGYVIKEQTTPMILERIISYDTGEVLAKGNIERAAKAGSERKRSVLDIPFLKTGAWETYYKNGNLETVGTYENDKPVGLWVKYDENGKVIEEIKKGSVK